MSVINPFTPQQSYPAATNGSGIPTWMTLSGTGVTNANPQTSAPNGVVYGGNNTYKVSLSLTSAGGLSNTVSVTAALFDNLNVSQAIVKTLTAISYNAKPTTSSGTQESYPAPNATVGDVATVGTPSGGVATVTANNEGQAVIEFEYPAFGNSETNYVGAGSGSPSLPQQNDMIYAQLLVNVGP